MVTNNSTNEPTAASGKVLQGQGVGTASAFSTATYPSATVGSGKVLYDNGTNFVTSTPTFPASASATTRKIIVSDGTNWVASTETWATPGTTGNVLTSDGTNWTSSTPGLYYVTGALTNTQIKNLHATPVQIVAAPGNGFVVQIIDSQLKMQYGGTNVFTAGAGQTIQISYGTTLSIATALLNASIVASSSQIRGIQGSFTDTAYSNVNNVAVNLYNPVATEISGNAANDNTMPYAFIYRIMQI